VIRRVVPVIAVLVAAVTWLPAAAGAGEGPTIAVLNVEQVLNQSKAGQGLRDKVEQIRAANQAKDQETESALRADDEKLQKQRAVLSEEAFLQKQKELQSRLDTLRQDFEARHKGIQAAVDKAQNEIRRAVLEVTRDVAVERQIDIVISQTATVLMSKDLDITQEVLDRLDAKLSDVPLAIEGQ
jgi:outer membrane protein